jgi:D-alanyl-D-alanine carboxypeptidase
MIPADLDGLWRELGIPSDYPAQRGLRRHREARRLVAVEAGEFCPRVELSPRAASAWKRLQAAARDDGIELVAFSGFRSIARQADIIRAHLRRGRRLDDLLWFVAAPGCSEHHTGRAVDVGTPGGTRLEESFARTAAFRWLVRRAKKFGFRLSYPRGNPHGFGYEPWHWCWHQTRRRSA